MNEILCGRFIRIEDESVFYAALKDAPAPRNASGRLISAGYCERGGTTVIFDGSFWLRENDPRIVSE